MRRALLVLAAISFSQLAAAQTAAGRADSGASIEPQNPADVSVSKDVANAGAGGTASGDASTSKDVANQRGDKQGELQGSLPQVEPRDRAFKEGAQSGAGGTAAREPTDKQSEEQAPERTK